MHSPVSDTRRLVMSELAAEPGPDASRAVEWGTGELLLREFEVDRRLGAGGFGSVTLVKSALTDRRYAMKTLKPELVARQRDRRAFAIELATWIELGAHPHVVRANFVRQIGATTALFMEYVTGGTLAEWIERKLVLDLEPIDRIAGEIAAGLDFAHARGLVHADLKPENVLLGQGGAKVSDFGLSVAIGVGGAGMTIAYRSPEQAAGAPLTRATDIWSFGLTVLAMFAGGPFWIDGQVAEAALQDFIDEPLPGRPPLPASAQAALRRCFAPHPEDRWPSATEAARALFGRAAAPATTALQAPSAAAEATEEEREIERWLLLAFELAGRDARDARARFPPRRATPAAQALADLDAFEIAAPLLEQHAAPERLSEFHLSWCGALWDIGDFNAAMEHAEKSVAALRRAEAPAPFALAATLRHAAFTALQCRRHTEAGPPLWEALRVLGAMGDDGAAEGPATLLRPELGLPLLHELGRTYTDAAQWARLSSHFEGASACASLAVKACALAAYAGPADASLLFDLALAHNEKATALKWLKQSESAVKSFRTAFELFIKSGHPERVSAMRVFCSNALRDLGRLDEAMAEVETAIAELTVQYPGSDALNIAYHARADLLSRQGDWQGALADFERERRYFERLVYDEGQRGMYRALAQAELYHALALARVGREEEALATVQHTINFLERLRRAGDWGLLNRELFDAHKLASNCQLSYALNGVSAHGSFPADSLHAGAIHSSTAAEHADAHHREQPDPEIALEAARLAFVASNLFESLLERDQARATPSTRSMRRRGATRMTSRLCVVS